MEQGVRQREVLVKYLLGELSPEEHSEISERYFADDDLFDKLLEVENDLLDKYVRGLLGESEREAFKAYLERLPNARHKEAIATALMQFTDEERKGAAEILKQHARAPISSWKEAFRSLAWPRGVLSYVATACIAMLAIGLCLLFFQLLRLRADNEQLRAEISRLGMEQASLDQRLRGGPADTSADRTPQVAEQPKPEQRFEEARAQPLANLQSSTPAVASWTLSPALRSTAEPDRVVLPRDAKFVSIVLPIESDGQSRGYRALIQTTGGERRRDLAGLRAGKNGTSVSFELPADYFSETSFKITLVGKDRDGLELARDYYFTVTKR